MMKVIRQLLAIDTGRLTMYTPLNKSQSFFLSHYIYKRHDQ
jgi:hypothetical protein